LLSSTIIKTCATYSNNSPARTLRPPDLPTQGKSTFQIAESQSSGSPLRLCQTESWEKRPECSPGPVERTHSRSGCQYFFAMPGRNFLHVAITPDGPRANHVRQRRSNHGVQGRDSIAILISAIPSERRASTVQPSRPFKTHPSSPDDTRRVLYLPVACCGQWRRRHPNKRDGFSPQCPLVKLALVGECVFVVAEGRVRPRELTLHPPAGRPLRYVHHGVAAFGVLQRTAKHESRTAFASCLFSEFSLLQSVGETLAENAPSNSVVTHPFPKCPDDVLRLRFAEDFCTRPSAMF